MEYSKDLELRLGVSKPMDTFEESFNRFYPKIDSTYPLGVLRRVKVHIYREWTERRAIFKGYSLESTDCLTIAILANLLAARKGVTTVIVRPHPISHYLHALLLYDRRNGEELFKVSGRHRNYEFVVMTPPEVEARLTYIKPIFDIANFLRCNGNIPAYRTKVSN